MQIRVGFELIYECPQPTPMILTLNVHYSRASDLVGPDSSGHRPVGAVTGYRDGFGNWCSRIVAPAGRIAHLHRRGGPRQRPADAVVRRRAAAPGRGSARGALVFLLGSRYCETDRLSTSPGSSSARRPPGWGARAGDLRLRAPPHHLRLRARAPDQDGLEAYNEGAASAATTRTSRSRSAAA